jgi:hypothetical protein
MQNITLSIKEHKGEQRLCAELPYDMGLIKIIKTVPGASWSQSEKQWHFNLNRQVVQFLEQRLGSLAKLDLSLLKIQLIERKQKQKEEKFAGIDAETTKATDYCRLWMEQKRYSRQTVKKLFESVIAVFQVLSAAQLQRIDV